MSRILSTFAPSPPSLLEALGIFASAGDAIFLPLLLRLFMPCRGNLRLMVRGIAGHYYEKMAAAIITRLTTHQQPGPTGIVPILSGCMRANLASISKRHAQPEG